MSKKCSNGVDGYIIAMLNVKVDRMGALSFIFCLLHQKQKFSKNGLYFIWL